MNKRTKYIAASAIAMLLSVNASAEKNGVRAGYSLSWWSRADTKFENVVHAPYVGYVHLMRVAPVLMFGTGADYQMTGFRIDSDNAINQHSLSVPAYLRLGLGPLLFVAGVHGSYSLVTTVPDGFDKKDFRSADWGAFVGAGYKISAVSIDARFYSNQVDRTKDTRGLAYTQMLQLGATVTF